MATLTAARAASSQAVAKTCGGGIMAVYHGSYDAATSLAAADVIEITRVPAGFVCLGGFLRCEDLDTNATETIELDVGDSGDADRLLNSGVLNGDAVTNYLPEGGVMLPLMGTLKDGPVTYASETVITVTVTAGAATAAAGTIQVVLFGYNP